MTFNLHVTYCYSPRRLVLEWINEEFLPENRSRLKAARGFLTGELQEMGIPYLDRPAALYVWADLRKVSRSNSRRLISHPPGAHSDCVFVFLFCQHLRESSFEEELTLWRRFLRHKVVVSCGQAFSCSTPGWFRIVFANQQRHLQLGQSVV